jgi:N-acetylglucosaminyldiphosphoundecaprenol N-acetyl-beta-D-mannosaminyltransferase
MTRRFIIVQLADIGDLVLSTPALSALREAHPDAQITLLTTSHAASVIPAGLVDRVLTLERHTFDHPLRIFHPRTLRQLWRLREGRRAEAILFFHHFTLKLGTVKFAWIALLSGARQRIGLQNGQGWFLNQAIPDGGFGGKHQAQYWLDLMGLLGASNAPRPAQVAREAYPLPVKHRPRIVIHPGSGGYSLARRWEAAGFARVADQLAADHDAEIILVGSPSDGGDAIRTQMQAPVHDLTGQTSLPQLAAVLATADGFIGADSGVMHLAAAVGTPTVAIFGPSNADAWAPWSPGGPVEVVRSAPPCSPCMYVEHGIGLRQGCAARTCMKMITPEQVVQTAEQLLRGEETEMQPSIASTSPVPQIAILGLPVSVITFERWLDLIAHWIQAGEKHHVCTLNPEFVMIARRDTLFRLILRRASVCVPDGVGLLWAARHLGTPLPERVTGSDGVPRIAERAAQAGWRMYLLGAAEGVAEQAAVKLSQQFPGVQIVGTYSGSPAPDEEDAIVTRINQAQADILFVAYGAPEQDKWIARNLPRLQVKMAMGVGGSLDFVAGIIPRAPLRWQRLGLEWLYRLYLQPWRIRRMLRLPQFVLAVLLRGSHG